MDGNYDGRAYLSKQIDDAVEGHLTDELLGMLVKQAYQLRYLSGDTERLNQLVQNEVHAFTKKLIGEWLKEHEDELWAAVEERMSDTHLKPMAEAVIDEFIADVSKARR